MNLPKRFKTLYMKSSQTRKRKIEGITESAIMQEEKTILGKKKYLLFTYHLNTYSERIRRQIRLNSVKNNSQFFKQQISVPTTYPRSAL